MGKITYEAGVLDGHRMVTWSSHRTESAAIKAARKYARAQGSHPGGAGAWNGYVRATGGEWTVV